MFTVENGKITVTRGDTGIISLDLTLPDGTPYEFLEGDSLTLSVKKNVRDTDYILQKTSSRPAIIFDHEDTDDIDPGNYIYDIEFRHGLGQVSTIGPDKFIVKYDVTRGDV